MVSMALCLWGAWPLPVKQTMACLYKNNLKLDKAWSTILTLYEVQQSQRLKILEELRRM